MIFVFIFKILGNVDVGRFRPARYRLCTRRPGRVFTAAEKNHRGAFRQDLYGERRPKATTHLPQPRAFLLLVECGLKFCIASNSEMIRSTMNLRYHSREAAPSELHGGGRFVLSRQDFVPAYVRAFEEGLLQERAEPAVESLRSRCVCPRDCQIDRFNNKIGVCKSGRHARVASAFPHFGEEDCLRGWNGSGTIFFGWCNLRCVFCQNSLSCLCTAETKIRDDPDIQAPAL